MSRSLIISLGVLLLAGFTSPLQAKDDLWLHVAVDGGEDDERVRVNVPVELMETVLPLIDMEEFSDGHIRIEGEDMSHEDIVAMLKAVSQAKDGEYVTVEDGNDFVRVAKDKDHILVHVEERSRRHRDDDSGEPGSRHHDSEKVDIRIPVEVLTALVSGKDEDGLDILAAVKALKNHAGSDLVTVHDNDGTVVRVWVDSQNVSD